MGRYLLLWRLDRTRVPLSSKDRGIGWSVMLETVKKDIKKGIQKDFGIIVGEGRGYGIVEGTEIEVVGLIEQFSPYVQFEVKPLMSIAQAEELIKDLQ